MAVKETVYRGRRINDDRSQLKTRSISRSSSGANILLFCYVALVLISLVGIYTGFRELATQMSNNGNGANDGGGSILAILTLTGSFVVTGILASLTRFLRRAIANHSIHRIRRFALFTFVLVMGALSLLSLRSGQSVLTGQQSGWIGVVFVFMALIALATFAGNRSTRE